jgi:hypothetical protein
VAFVDEEKFLTCITPNSSVVLNRRCEGIDTSNATIQWCIQDGEVSKCFDTRNHTFTTSNSVELSISSTGELNISRVSVNFRGNGSVSMSGSNVQCSLLDEDGVRCGDEVQLHLVIHAFCKTFDKEEVSLETVPSSPVEKRVGGCYLAPGSLVQPTTAIQ